MPAQHLPWHTYARMPLCVLHIFFVQQSGRQLSHPTFDKPHHRLREQTTELSEAKLAFIQACKQFNDHECNTDYHTESKKETVTAALILKTYGLCCASIWRPFIKTEFPWAGIEDMQILRYIHKPEYHYNGSMDSGEFESNCYTWNRTLLAQPYPFASISPYL